MRPSARPALKKNHSLIAQFHVCNILVGTTISYNNKLDDNSHIKRDLESKKTA